MKDIEITKGHLNALWHYPHWAELPESGVLPVAMDLLHCLQSTAPQLLQLKVLLEPHPGDHLHISFTNFIII
jgi:hypothetical protein